MESQCFNKIKVWMWEMRGGVLRTLQWHCRVTMKVEERTWLSGTFCQRQTWAGAWSCVCVCVCVCHHESPRTSPSALYWCSKAEISVLSWLCTWVRNDGEDIIKVLSYVCWFKLMVTSSVHWFVSCSFSVGFLCIISANFESHLSASLGTSRSIRHRNVPWVWGPMLKAVWSPAGLSFLTGSFVDRISVWPGNWRESTLVTTGFHVWFLQTILFCWHHQARTFVVHWSSLQLQWELASPNLRPWFSSRKKGWVVPFGLVGKAWLKWRSLNTLRSCEVDECTVMVKKARLELPANHCSYSHLCSWILDNDRKDKISDTSGQNYVAELHMEARASFTDASLWKCPRHVPPG